MKVKTSYSGKDSIESQSEIGFSFKIFFKPFILKTTAFSRFLSSKITYRKCGSNIVPEGYYKAGRTSVLKSFKGNKNKIG